MNNLIPDYLQGRGISSVDDNAGGKVSEVSGKQLFQIFKEQLVKQYVRQPGSPLASLARGK